MKASLNYIFRTIWSDALNTWVAVSEITSAKGKRSGSCILSAAALADDGSESGKFLKRDKRLWPTSLVFALACCYGISAQANPVGAQVVSGSVSINQSGTLLTVTNSPNAIINWQGFSIGSGQATNFVQQSSGSSVLNRVVGTDPSTLLGTLTSNGKVYLVNPAGIFVGQGARIDVQGFFASTLNLSNADFLAGNLNFTTNPGAGTIQNNGTITTPEGGTVYLIAPQVTNYGIINTPQGETILAAGNTVQLVDTGTPGVAVEITGSSNNATNLGQIIADSGRIGMMGAVVNNSGKISADSLVSQGGEVYLKATNRVTAGGTISANGAGGGTIQLLGDQVGVMDDATVTANGTRGGGTINVGGGWQGSGGIPQATTVTIAKTATLNASATDAGKGGTVVAWSDVTNPNSQTRVYGTLLAQGGPNGGNGGNIETSGHWLDVAGITANASASKGMGGEWLLDPYNVTIGSAASGDAYAPPSFLPSTQDSTILASDIANALQGGSNVTITTGSTGASVGDITVSSSILTGSMANDATLTLAAYRNVIVTNLASIDATGSGNVNKLNVILNSNTGLGGGGILLDTGSSILSNGGNIVMGGGATPASGYAIGTAGSNNSGIHVLGDITAGAGNVTMNGQSALGNGITFAGGTLSSDGTVSINGTTSLSGGGTPATFTAGIRFQNAGTRLTTAIGTVTVTGLTSAGVNSQGVTVDASTIETTGVGSLTLSGTNTVAGNSGWGIGINTGGLVHSTAFGGGSLNFSAVSQDWGNVLFNGSIISNGGSINMTDQSTNGIFLAGTGGINAGTNGSISLTTDRILISNTLQALGGTLNIAPFTPGASIGIAGGVGTMQLPASYFSTYFATGFFGGITVGSPTSGDITVGGATTANDSLTLISGGAININAALSVTASNTLMLAGGTTVSGNGNITATDLLLSGVGPSATYTLNTATANSVHTLSAAGVAGLSFTNSGALTINGINASGPLYIATTSGDMTVSQIVGTTNATSSAVVLNAGTSDAVGTTTDNIVLSGSGAVSVGAGGTAALYTGSIASSTGLTYLVGSGSGNFRYDSNATTTNYTAPLVAGTYAIYREQPTLTITANSPAAITYGDVTPTLTATVIGVNGDTAAQALSTAATVTTDGIVSNAGKLTAITHTLTASGAVDQLGYALNYATGTLTVNKKSITTTGITSPGKIYDGGTTASLGGTATLTNGAVNSTDNKLYTGDSVTVSGGTGSYADKNVGPSKAVTVTGQLLGGPDAANYTVTDASGATAAITAKALTETGLSVAASKIYDGTTHATVSGTAVLGTEETAGAGSTSDGLPYTGDTVAITGTPTGTYNGKDVTGGSAGTTVTFGGLALNNSNYTLTMQTPVSATITAKALTETGLSVAASKIYDGTTNATVLTPASLGTEETAGAGSTSDGLPYTGDTVAITGTPTGTFNGKDVTGGSAGTTVTLGGLALNNSNYTLTMQAPVSASITPRPVTLTVDPGQGKTYGQPDPFLITFNDTAGTMQMVTGETPTGTLTRATGENAGTYAVGQGSLNNTNNPNYNITFVTNNFTINPAQLSIVTNPQTKVYGSVDPVPSFVATGLVSNVALGIDDVAAASAGTLFSGTLTREAGQNVGLGSTNGGYAYVLGTLSAGSNYTIGGFTSNVLTITPRAVTLIAPSVSKIYDGGLSYTPTTNDLAALTVPLVFASDIVTAATITYADKNPGIGNKAVSLNAVTINDGNGGKNYLVTLAGNNTSTITYDTSQQSVFQQQVTTAVGTSTVALIKPLVAPGGALGTTGGVGPITTTNDSVSNDAPSNNTIPSVVSGGVLETTGGTNSTTEDDSATGGASTNGKTNNTGKSTTNNKDKLNAKPKKC